MFKNLLKRIVPPKMGDVISGVSNALVYLPQGIGYAILSGVNASYGLYAGIFAPIIAALFNRSVLMSVTATNELSIPTGTIVSQLGKVVTPQEFATLTLLVGVFAVLAGVLKLGELVRFISNSVMTGFVTGIMIALVIDQLPNLLGLSITNTNGIPKLVVTLFNKVHSIDTASVIVGILTILLIALFRYLHLSDVSYLLAMIILSVAVQVFKLTGVALTSSQGPISNGFPKFVLPDLTAIPKLMIPALSLVLIGLTFGAGVAERFPNPDEEEGNVSRDFIGQGLANLVSAFFHSLPTAGSMSRTAFLVQSGAKTRWSNIFSGLTTLVIVLFAANLAERIPRPVIAGILIVIGITSIDLKKIRLVWLVNWAERTIMVLTFLFTIFLSPILAILIGVPLTIFAFVWTSARSIEVVRLEPIPNGGFVEKPIGSKIKDNSINIFQIRGYLYFASFARIEHKLKPTFLAKNAVIILSFRGFSSISSTGIVFLERYEKELKNIGNHLILTDLSPSIIKELELTGTIKIFGSDNIFKYDANNQSLVNAISQGKDFLINSKILIEKAHSNFHIKLILKI